MSGQQRTGWARGIGCAVALAIVFIGPMVLGTLMEDWEPRPFWPKTVVSAVLIIGLLAIAKWIADA